MINDSKYDCVIDKQKQEILLRLIDKLEPKKEMFAGIQFLRLLLKEQGVDGCMGFLDKATKALSEKDGLDLAFDFTKSEKALFDRAVINFMTRRNFLHTAGWAIPGAVTFAHAGVSIADKIMSAKQEQPKQSSLLKQTERMMEHYLLPPSELLIGAALMNEGYEKYLEIKLEQIADAVSELSDKIHNEKSQGLGV